MNFPRSIGFRFTLGFGLLIIAIVVNVILTQRMISDNQSACNELSTIQEPSLRLLIEMRATLHQSLDLLETWDRSGRDPDSDLLRELEQIIQVRIPEINRQIIPLADNWPSGNEILYNELFNQYTDSVKTATLVYIRNLLPESAAEADSAAGMTSPLAPAYNRTDNFLGDLIQVFELHTAESRKNLEITFRKTRTNLLIISILIAAAVILIAFLLYLAIVNPVKQYRDTITSMGKGVIPDKEFREGTDEMGQIGVALNSMIKGLGDLSEFAEEIGKGNFNSAFTPKSEKDILGNSLIQLRQDLQKAAIEEEKRKREDERRNWSNQGIARFSEILREYPDDSQSLANNLIAELVNYLGARVGGIFLVRGSHPKDSSIDLVASYAYDRIKQLKKNIQPGEGLVGRCIQEGSTIFLTDIPDDYIKIKSGLGEDKPKSLLIVPIRLNDQIIGVLEIASLEVFGDFQIEFVERIGTSIASSLSREQFSSPDQITDEPIS